MADSKPAVTKTPNPPADPEGKVSNTPDGAGTRQTEPRPEELPADAKIAPLAEQTAPNQTAKAVGAIEAEHETKTLGPDMSDAHELLPDDSEQHDAADRANAAADLRSKGLDA